MNQKQKILFFENLWNLITSWIPVIQALDIIIFQTKAMKLKKIWNKIKEDIELWESLFKVSLKNKKIFNIFDMAMLEIWDATWQIWRSLELISEKEEKEMNLKRKVLQVMIYPISIIIVTLMMITSIMIYVIPKIELMYKESNVNLPELTTIVISVSHFFVNNILSVLIWIFLTVYLLYLLLKNKNVKYFADKNILSIPLFGEIIKKKILVNFTDFLSTLLASGVIINKALLIIKSGTANSYYSKELTKIIDDIKNWMPLSDSMWWNYIFLQNKENLSFQEKNELEKAKKRSQLFPIELTTGVKIWEQTWTLAKMLHKSSLRYSKDIDNTIKNLSTMLEPIIIVVIWGIVGTIILAILLPFLNIANVIK
ncbi:MAG: hypothetical protein ACD_4C00233G0006 [uncultured bacterium (gcode 4)]|uniref:Type II secretion system protein GspF domain-containing protein n=1 Tax=uncultured bacterium (gcode 4) TaxID=1234023 RepID=K2GTD0_9BACT|nr:MAG: hypothetical protein ACD_4C00233G0006 [uncultured bacterium (gcode 4)]